MLRYYRASRWFISVGHACRARGCVKRAASPSSFLQPGWHILSASRSEPSAIYPRIQASHVENASRQVPVSSCGSRCMNLGNRLLRHKFFARFARFARLALTPLCQVVQGRYVREKCVKCRTALGRVAMGRVASAEFRVLDTQFRASPAGCVGPEGQAQSADWALGVGSSTLEVRRSKGRTPNIQRPTSNFERRARGVPGGTERFSTRIPRIAAIQFSQIQSDLVKPNQTQSNSVRLSQAQSGPIKLSRIKSVQGNVSRSPYEGHYPAYASRPNFFSSSR